MVATRRFGTETSKTRGQLLHAAETLMLAEGYAAVSSRRVAATAGLKPALVHYYFATMDDLFLALYRWRAEEGLQRQARALESAQPLWALWEFSRDPRGTALTMEFVALANHRKAIRAEIAAASERFRADQLKALKSILKRYKVDTNQFPPIVLAVLLTSVSRVLVIEQESLGIATGHGETLALAERFLVHVEGPRQLQTDNTEHRLVRTKPGR